MCEHWLNCLEEDVYSNIFDLKLVSMYCRSNITRGGASIYVNNGMSCKPIDIRALCLELHFEAVAVEITDLNIIVVALYRSPDGDFELFVNQMEQCLVKLFLSNKKIVVCGDYNVHFESSSNEEDLLVNLFRSYGLFLTSRLPTRKDACLDAAFTNLESTDYKVAVYDPLVSDHAAIVMSLVNLVGNVDATQPLWHTKYTFSTRYLRPDLFPQLRSLLAAEDWLEHCAGDDADAVFGAFHNVFKLVYDYVFPERTLPGRIIAARTSRPRPSKHHDKAWYTPALGQLRGRMQLLFDLYKSAQPGERETFYQDYLRIKKLYSARVQEAKRVSNQNFIEQAHNPCKAAWDLVNVHRSRKSPVTKLVGPDEFNNFFADSVIEIVNEIPKSDYDPLQIGGLIDSEYCNGFFHWRETSPEHILKLVRGFKNSSSQDVYGVSIVVLKEVIDVLAAPLAKVINMCLKSGTFPNLLKVSRTVPIYKKGDPDVKNNYRPISIIPVFAKVLESIMKEQLVEFFEGNMLLADCQHGFRKNRSTTSALLALTAQINDVFESKESVSLLLCDLSKAFDVVDHGILMSKLRCYGVGGVALQLLASYLEDRMQLVTVGGAKSDMRQMSHGVPQGSVLGPLLFLIYINDLTLEGRTLLFADDTTVIARDVRLGDVMNKSDLLLKQVQDWFCCNKLKMNDDKTQKILFTLSRNLQLPAPKDTKLLGFWLDSRLSWDRHIDQVCVKLSRVLFLLRRLKKIITTKYLLTVYYSLFHSHISYGILLWGHAPRCNKILLLQKKAVRLILSAGNLEHCRPLFSQLGVLTVYGEYVHRCLVSMKEQERNLPTRQDVHNYGTRFSQSLNVPRCRLAKTLNSYPASAMRMYNKLPPELKMLEGIGFKRAVHELLVNSPLYSLSEFYETF